MGHQNTTVWGTGLLFYPSKTGGHSSLFRKLDVRAVRGPKTRATLIEQGHSCPEIYGDSAIIMPEIHNPKTQKITERQIIPHFSREDSTEIDCTTEKKISMRTNDFKTVIDDICSSKIVCSSSLHGIILAESYGVPAIFYQDRPSKSNFKYDDLYQSTGRKMKVYSSLMEARSADSYPVPDLTKMRKSLMDVFPYELWVE